MAYRSERFEVGELAGLGQVFGSIDGLEALGLAVEDEIIAGNSHRRRLHEDTVGAGYGADYLIQATFRSPPPSEGRRITANYFVSESARILGELELPGSVTLDGGGLHGLDPTTSKLAFGSTGDTDKDLLFVYPPWLKASWLDKGRQCLFFCGILPPEPKGFYEEHPVRWDTRLMRDGRVVFKETPPDIKTY